MAASPRNNPRPVLAPALLGLLGMDAFAAPVPCTNQEIIVEAKPWEVDYRNNNAVLREVVITQCDMRIQAAEARVTGGLNFENSLWTISGDVQITAEGGSLHSEKAIVSFRDNLISQATITGTPARFEQQREDGTTSRGRANTIDYETRTGTVSLTTDAWLSDGRNEISGQQLVYNIRSQSVQGQTSPASGGNGDGRVRIVIQPRTPAESSPPEPDEPEQKP
jgi:lipopolysaccharide export system protein LptA